MLSTRGFLYHRHMLAVAEVIEHAAGLLTVALVAAVPGWVLVGCARRQGEGTRWAEVLSAGVAFWAIALYVAPVRGGLWWAGAAALLAAVVRIVWAQRGAARRSVATQRCPRSHRRARLVLLLGCLPLFTPLLFHRVPAGMDASRYLCNTRLIAVQAGLPATLAPFAPQIAFGAANHGVSTWAAAAVLSGVRPEAALLATVPLSYALLVCGVYALIRRGVRRVPAAAIAVGCVWLARAPQETLSWGGFPGVLAVALGCFAAGRLLDVLRRGRAQDALLLALLVGAMPLVHACMAAGWLYIVAPPVVLAGLYVSRRRGRGVIATGAAGVLALLIVGIYALVGHPGLDAYAADWIRTNEMASAFGGRGWGLLGTVPVFIARKLGRLLTALLLVGLAAGMARRRCASGLVVLSVSLLLLTVANARLAWLPGSLLLYPTRLVEWGLPLAALAVGVGWRTVARVLPRSAAASRVTPIIACIFLFIALTHHARYFQPAATRPTVDRDTWAALEWCRTHLDPTHDFVATLYLTPGAYLPGVAGVGATQWHAHIAKQLPAALAMEQHRPVTHVLWIDRAALVSESATRIFDERAGQLQRWIAQGQGLAVFTRGGTTVYRLQTPLAAADLRG